MLCCPRTLHGVPRVVCCGGEVRWCVWWCVWWTMFPFCYSLSSFHPSSCVCCHSIVGLVWCLCDTVVSLWNSGDGSCWGRRAVGAARRDGSARLVLSSSSVVVFGVVRAQPCEHARYPRTPLRLSCGCFLFSSLLHSPPFFPLRLSLCLEWRWVNHHVSECSVGMTATGSLSRSSFFW